MATPIRHLVLDNEAVSALLSTGAGDRKRREVVLAVMAANGHRSVPTAVRCEAMWDRTDRTAADANRLVPYDDAMDTGAGNRNVQLRRLVPSASLVDAAVAVAAERMSGGVIEVLTSDVADVRKLAAHIASMIDVRRI